MSAECKHCGRDLDGDFNCGACECERRLALAIEALGDAQDTICSEFCTRDKHHPLCDRPRFALSKLSKTRNYSPTPTASEGESK